MTRLTTVVLAALATVLTAVAQTAPAYDCAAITIEGHTYDISALKPTTYRVTGQPVDGHPFKTRVDYLLNPCQAIPIADGAASSNCVAGTWVCQDTKLIKEGADPETAFLRPIAGSAAASGDVPAREVSPTAVRAAKLDDSKELPWNLTLKGGFFDEQEQSAVIAFVCDMSATDVSVAPTFSSYKAGVATFTWKSLHACPKLVDLPRDEGMSGFSVFLTVLSVFGLLYIAAGAVYNHQVYGAKGLDLLPNLDFWRDVPGLVLDVLHHLWDSVTGRASSSRGYVSV